MNTPSAALSAAGGVDIPTQTAAQYWIALGATVVIFALITIYWYYSQYLGLNEAQRQHKAAITRSKHAQSPLTYRIPSRDDAASHVKDLRELFTAAMDGNLSADPEHISLRTAFAELHSVLRDRAQSRFSHIPGLSIIGVEAAVAVFVTGALAVSTDAIVRLLAYESGGVGGVTLVTTLADQTVAVFTSGHDVIAWFPYSGLLWQLLFTVWILGTQWLYNHWLFLAALLVAVAVAIAVLDHVSGTPDSLYESPAAPAKTGAAALVYVWFIGMTFGVLGSLAGAPEFGAALGFLAATIWVLYFLARGFRRFTRRVRTWSARHSGETRAAAAYIVLRPVLIGAVGVSLPLVGLYTGVILLEGKLSRVAGAYLTASLEVQIFVLAVVVGIIGAVLYVGRDAWPDLRSAVVEAGSRKRVQAAVIGRGVPYLAVAIGYVAAYSITQSILTAVVVAAIAGVAAWAGYTKLRSVQHRTQWLFDDKAVPKSVLVEVFAPVDADGDRHLLIRVDGRVELAYDTVEDAVEDVPDHIDAVSAGDHAEADASLDAWYAHDMQAYGFADSEESRNRIEEEVRTTALGELRSGDRSVNLAELEESLEDYPAEVWESWRDHWRKKSIIRVRDGYVTLRRDPYAKS